MDIISFLKSLDTAGIQYHRNEPMCKHTTFKTGGNADVFLDLSSRETLIYALNAAKEFSVPVFILGKGSNILVSDDGIEGVVICLSGLDEIKICANHAVCGAGAPLAAVCISARDAGLSGMEFAYGIPGTLGGALYMNAGAYGGEMSQVVKSAEVLDLDGNISEILSDDMLLGYRTSVFSKKEYIILSVTLELSNGKKDSISKKMDELLARRKAKQPLCFPSAGSTFKRPEGYFAGALIEKNNLKGECVGGAMVSEIHAGFVVNAANACSADILKLIRKVQETVYRNDSVLLKTEVLFVGRPPHEDILPYTDEGQIK